MKNGWVIGGMDGRKAISGKIDIVLKHQLGKNTRV